MLFALICTDNPGALAIRKANRPAHLEYLQQLDPRVKAAGPFLTEDGAEPRGSLVIVEAASITAARAIADADPYARAGLFQSVDIRAWSWVIGNPAT